MDAPAMMHLSECYHRFLAKVQGKDRHVSEALVCRYAVTHPRQEGEVFSCPKGNHWFCGDADVFLRKI